MKNCEIIEHINHFCTSDKEIDLFNTDIAFTILAHGYLYVKPGKDTEAFMEALVHSIKVGVDEGISNFLKIDDGAHLLDEWIRNGIANAIINVARKAFNAKHFKKQSALLDAEEEVDENMLDKYLNLMDKEQLVSFKYIISDCAACHCVFSNYERQFEADEELNILCRKIDASIPDIHNAFEYITYVDEHFDHIYEILKEEEIAHAIKRPIFPQHMILAGQMARIYYHSNNYKTIRSYSRMVGTIMRAFDNKVYTPNIFWETLDWYYEE